jgi:excisionase family DNA binding protein
MSDRTDDLIAALVTAREAGMGLMECVALVGDVHKAPWSDDVFEQAECARDREWQKSTRQARRRQNAAAAPAGLTLTPIKAAAYVGIGRTKLLGLIAAGRIEARKLDGRIRVVTASLDAFLASLPRTS